MRFRIPAYRLIATSTLFSLFLVLNSGCTYMHQPQKDALAKETVEEFKKFQEKSATLYPAMLENLQVTESRVSEVQDKLAQQRELSFANRVHTLTWEQIKKGLQRGKQGQEARKKQLLKEISNLLEKMGEAKVSLHDLKEGLNRAKDALGKAIQQENKWKAQAALFRGTIPLVFQAIKNDKLDVNQIEADKAKVLDQLVEVRDSPKPKTVGAILDCKDLVPLLENYNLDIFNPKKAPGLTVTILSLALELSQAEYDRARLKVDYLGALIESLQAEIEGLNSGYGEIALDLLDSLIAGRVASPKEKVLGTLNRLRRQPEKVSAFDVCARVLAYYAVMRTMEESAVLRLQSRPAILAHEYSIKLSAIDSREHEALIARGLEGLAIYHQGGIKPEMIANFLRAAQAAALAVIGAGVL